MENRLRLGLKETMRLENGTVVSTVARQKQRRAVGEVALHEAAHVVVAGQIHSATIIPTSEYQGATRPVVMTAESAMAAYAMGFHGTGWDEFLTKNLLGADPGAAAGSAASILAGKQEEMVAVAEELEENGTIGQDHVTKAFTSVALRRAGIHPVEVTVEKPDGTKQIHETKSAGEMVMVPSVWYKVDSKKQSATATAEEQQQS